MLSVGSLFAGIGGFDLGLERTGGFKVKWQVEIDPFCQKVLAKHWPDVQRYGDIRNVTGVERVDVLCGGFPCQDISNAGELAGIDGERSGLWSEYVRLISDIRPRYVIVENVAALLGRGMDRVLGDISESGYDAEWRVISAADLGAPHLRERVWILAYPRREGIYERGRDFNAGEEVQHLRRNGRDGVSRQSELQRQILADTNRVQTFGASVSREECAAWPVEPAVGRVAHGIPNRVDRLKGLGNAIVPQIAEWIGNRILGAEKAA